MHSISRVIITPVSSRVLFKSNGQKRTQMHYITYEIDRKMGLEPELPEFTPDSGPSNTSCTSPPSHPGGTCMRIFRVYKHVVMFVIYTSSLVHTKTQRKQNRE